jgi:hypothetical protein
VDVVPFIGEEIIEVTNMPIAEEDVAIFKNMVNLKIDISFFIIGGASQHHSFSSFTSSQQSEVEGNDTGLVEKLQQNETIDQFGNNKPQEKLVYT